MKKILLSLSLLLCSFYAASEMQYVSKVVPKNLHVYNLSGDTFVDLQASGCSNYRYYLSPTHPKYDAIFSLFLSAQLARKTVSIRFDGCNAQTQGKIVGVFLD
ncbi:hypothetical protein BS333_05525 [Vibrio azureus]|uniref:KTSC domain-containing protein n=1 Tax=Vibrio azureus NBRC 104587 TaxID=1219077 RepID=U3CFN4_9VIBR|nr:hypothetical protein [Vibrio azureus]AUI85881.1 hypothetical protein BS333_05525 [Vibrio azureus]GAD77103.1 hypothetical protein VAZ01S_062_00060 [Vibrio azureus NBRC 104587]